MKYTCSRLLLPRLELLGFTKRQRSDTKTSLTRTTHSSPCHQRTGASNYCKFSTDQVVTKMSQQWWEKEKAVAVVKWTRIRIRRRRLSMQRRRGQKKWGERDGRGRRCSRPRSMHTPWSWLPRWLCGSSPGRSCASPIRTIGTRFPLLLLEKKKILDHNEEDSEE
jgi:hypothetical protein